MADQTNGQVFEYVALHQLIHDGVVFEKGDVFSTTDKALGDRLRADKAIALATEVQSADDVAARIAALEAQLAEAQAKLQSAQADEVAAEAAAAAAKSAKK